ncbi:6-phosphogluconolactonase [Mariniphaga anaerophila]|uniref:6-phosphogluconolactonase n=1 Tax=Mariniphaga anaerophila TaxID=1484053 RepID=A0A1M5A3S3_9BACT|nr:lactonase family protein [Mariniphaga anaerophila]SHF24943.1 6-phosphogluconolactonase [Mariniphaga anaerophila]
MLKFYIGIICMLLSGCIFAQNTKIEKFYVGTFTSEGAEGIYLCNFDSATGEIALTKTFKGIDNPSFLKISPDKNFLYAVTRPQEKIEESGGYLQAYKIEKDGSLKFINKQVSNGSDPCHVDVSPDGKFVAIATYGSGTTSLYQVTENGGINSAASTIVNTGSGLTSRQKAPHAHSIKFSKNGKQVFSADLGTDKLNIFDLKKSKLVPAKQPFVKLTPGAGPRHFAFHPHANIIYVINELNSTVYVLEKQGKNWEVVQSVLTIPENFSGENYCADIHVSADGKFVYGSNRGHNSIVVFKTDPLTKQLEFITTVSTRGDWPRNFTLSPDGKFLLAANQRTGNIVVFKIEKNTGIPEFSGNEIKLPAPVCLEFL